MLIFLPSRWFRLSARGGVPVVAMVLASAVMAQGAGSGWPALAGYGFREAHRAFVEEAPGPWRDLGLAASLLNHPPVTPAKVARAERVLEDLSLGPDPEVALAAGYLQCRVAHDHREEPILAVEERYRRFLDRAGDHAFGQLAACHLALLRLYQRTDLAPEARVGAAAEVEPIAGRTALPEIAHAYYRALADAVQFYELDDPRALRWLQMAAAIGTADLVQEATLHLRVAEAARARGDTAVASAHYRRFLAIAPGTDKRRETATEHLAVVEGAP